MIKCLFLLFVLRKVGSVSVVECQGCNNSNSNSISRDKFYYDNYNDNYNLIFENYYAWISLKDKDKDKDKDRDKDRDKTSRKRKRCMMSMSMLTWVQFLWHH